MFSLFQLLGKTPEANEKLKIFTSGLTKDSPQILTIRIEISSQPCALFKSKAHTMANTLASSIVIPSNR